MTQTTADRPEAKLLLLCARSRRDSETTDVIRALLRKRMDWTYLSRMAIRHRMVPLLYWHLTSCPEAVPEDVLEEFRHSFHANMRRNLFMTGELVKTLNELEAHGISAVPYKGPALAALAYKDLGLREFRDLDIVVRERDVMKATKVLVSLGYQPRDRITRAQEAAFLRHRRECVLMSDDGNMIELQWKVTQTYVSSPLNLDYLWKRTVPISLGGPTVLTFTAEDLLLILCVHGCTHYWIRLGWICDIAELIRVSEGLDWEELLERADTLNSRRMLLLGLFLANDMLGVDLPETVSRAAWTDAMVQSLAGDVRERIFSENPLPDGIFGNRAFQRFHLQMMDRPRDKLRYFFHQATVPTAKEWAIVQLPAIFSPIYRLLRIIRVTGSSGQTLARSFLDRVLKRRSFLQD